MTKKKLDLKNPMVILVLVLLAIFAFKGKTTFIGAAADISSAIVTRSLPTTVKANSPFDAIYTASGMGAGSWGVIVEDDIITGGCTPAAIDIGWLSPTLTYNMPMTASSTAGTCTFGGTYIFGGDTDKSIVGTTLLNICEDECVAAEIGCEDASTRYTCDTSGVCGVKQLTSCGAGFDCSAGVCIADCPTLKSTALSSIVTWSGDPTSTNKNAALTAIVAWATEC